MEIESEKTIEDQTESNCILGEPYFSQFSKEIFKNKFFGYICGIYLNFIYIHNWLKNKNIFSLLLILYMNYLLIKIILGKLFKQEENKEHKEYNYELEIKKMRERFRKIISLEDPSSTIRTFIYIHLLLLLTRLLGDKFILLLILNILVFHTPINNRFPNFIFNSIMSIKQTIEGVFGILECFIPRYVDKKELNK